MSKWIDKLDDGTYDIQIADEDGCEHMYNEVCCWDESPMRGDYPDHHCLTCEFFMDENGNKRKKDGE